MPLYKLVWAEKHMKGVLTGDLLTVLCQKRFVQHAGISRSLHSFFEYACICHTFWFNWMYSHVYSPSCKYSKEHSVYDYREKNMVLIFALWKVFETQKTHCVQSTVASHLPGKLMCLLQVTSENFGMRLDGERGESMKGKKGQLQSSWLCTMCWVKREGERKRVCLKCCHKSQPERKH